MKLRSTILWLVCTLTLAACVKDEYARTSSYMVNHSAHRIVVTPYLRDSAVLGKRITLIPGDSLLVNQSDGAGKDGASSWVLQAQAYDSLHVLYVDTSAALPRDTARIGHLRQGGIVSYTHFIPYSSPRSLLNAANWTGAPVEETRYLLRSNFHFTFTEQDYLDAR
ncbi:MAG: hypothetical protein EOP50_18790 [Sphingobacteriales bacterium]|nr:MAG: hypothetical protein EOP50_18790 [Sphingobacteriales bacterium]